MFSNLITIFIRNISQQVYFSLSESRTRIPLKMNTILILKGVKKKPFFLKVKLKHLQKKTFAKLREVQNWLESYKNLFEHDQYNPKTRESFISYKIAHNKCIIIIYQLKSPWKFKNTLEQLFRICNKFFKFFCLSIFVILQVTQYP